MTFGIGLGRNRIVKDSGYCFCPNCGYTTAHMLGVPCFQLICPNCNIRLIRGE